MKLIDNKTTIIFIFCIIFLYHYYIQNGLEKLFSQCYFDYYDVNRPLNKCNNRFNINFNLRCIGMPSGHAETASLMFSLLYIYKFISLEICILSILIFSIQRVITNMHTIGQVSIGIFLGIIYSLIYSFTNCSLYSFGIVFFISIILVVLIIHKININFYKPIPSWVDHQMYSSIKNKMEIPYYIKMLTIYANAYTHDVTFLSWDSLELYLDDIIERIKNTGIQFDGVVGIKTGGAIISDYISKKLNITNYKIKVSRSEYNCDKKPVDVMNDLLQKKIFKNLGVYTVCEGIDDDLRGKNIILIDEFVSSGTTMLSAIQYLRDEKDVDIIFPTAISLSKRLYKNDVYIHYVLPKIIYIWPWGYDN